MSLADSRHIPFALVLSALGLLLLVSGVGTIAGRRRIARNMRAARISTGSAGGMTFLGIIQVGLGVACLLAAWVPAGSESSEHHSRSIQRFFEGLDRSSGVAGAAALLLGVIGVGAAVWILVSFVRSTRDRDQSDPDLSPDDVRQVYFAAASLVVGVLALFSSAFFVLGWLNTMACIHCVECINLCEVKEGPR
ncbi:hypothetical protein [Microbacterium sp. NPDC090003]|uniref:hypothetical protein n=1 Tax=Microbacterium sp. NPDC090003 TaxID=3364203 RepID=UPI00382032DD